MLRILVPKDHRWWISFVLLFLLGALWSLASPVFSVPDEGAHVIKAAAVARGELLPVEVPTPRGPLSSVKVPDVFARTFGAPCYAFNPEVSVDCAGPLEGTSEVVSAFTSAGRYPPPYYFLVGLPSLVSQSARGVRLMRLVSTGLSAALLASAFASARETSRSRFVVIGLAVAVTPMVLYLTGSVNPNGLEIAAAATLWASLIALVLGPSFPPSTRTIARVGVAASTLAMSRPLSPVWVVLIGLVVVAMAEGDRLKALVRNRVVWFWAAVSGLCLLAAAAWVMVFGALELLAIGTVTGDVGATGIARRSIGETGNEVLHMIGVFGWLDTMAARVTYYAWFACLGFLILAGLASARRRPKLVLGGLILLVVTLPRVIEASQARTLGYVWQGRYTLPLAMGVPMVAALLADDLWGRIGKSLNRMLIEAMVIGHVFAFLWAYRRNAVGISGPLSPLDWPGATRAVSLVVMFTVVTAAYGWWVIHLATPEHVALQRRVDGRWRSRHQADPSISPRENLRMTLTGRGGRDGAVTSMNARVTDGRPPAG